MKWIAAILLGGLPLLFGSCQRELNFESVATGYLVAQANGQCSAANTSANFIQDSSLDNSQTVTLFVHVISLGSYQITSDTLNGFFFSANGNFTRLGDQSVVLKATGRPQQATTNLFTFQWGNSICQLPIQTQSAAGAVFSLAQMSGNCTGAQARGFCKKGVPLNGSQTVSLFVNVTTAGTFSISTPVVNGIQFSGSGQFATTGLQQVVLTGTGTPVEEGDFNFSTNSIAAACIFSVMVYPPFSGGLSAFNLSSVSGSGCSGVVQNGTFMAGTALASGAGITLQVNVVSTGGYVITTDTVNGISFRAIGAFTSTGPQQVTLKGTGTPQLMGDFNFTTTAMSGYCIFTLTIQPPAQFATFALAGTPNSCIDATALGSYQVGIALDASNQASLRVLVTAPGYYSIQTNVSNGFSFLGTGQFTNTGTQFVLLKGTGTPSTAGTFTYNAITGSSTGASSCGFNVTSN